MRGSLGLAVTKDKPMSRPDQVLPMATPPQHVHGHGAYQEPWGQRLPQSFGY